MPPIYSFLSRKIEAWLANPKLGWALVAVGVLLRIVRYVHNPSLWFDEAALALNLISRTYRELLEPLSLAQQAPVGFLMIEKGAIGLMGSSEHVLRMFPFLCGVVALALFLLVARRVLSTAAANLTMLLFAISDWPAYFSSELKPYSVDICFGLLLIWVGLRFVDSADSDSNMVGFGVAGSIAILVSYPSVFFLFGIGLAILWKAWRQRDWSLFSRFFILITLWLSVFAFVYTLFLRPSTTSPGLTGWFSDYFAPFPPATPGQLFWYPRTFFSLFEIPGGFRFSGLAALLFTYGVVRLRRVRPLACQFLLFPWLAALFASMAHMYPFQDRLLLFLVPSILLPIGYAMSLILQEMRGRSAPLALLSCAVLLFHPVTFSLNQLFEPRSRQEVRPLLETLNRSFQKDDHVYVYYRSWPVFGYYLQERKELHVSNIVVGQVVVGPSGFGRRHLHHHEDITRLRGNKRVWIFLTHYGDEEQHILGVLDSIGERLQTQRDQGSALYLYDLSTTATK